LHNAPPFALPPYKGKWPEIWIAAHGPRMLRATDKYADGWFPGTTRATQYGADLDVVRAAASDAGRHPADITPALIVSSSPAADWARHGAQHPLGADFTGVQDLIPQLIDEQTALSYAAKAPKSLVEELFAVGTPDEVIDQIAEFRDHGMRQTWWETRRDPAESAQERRNNSAVHQGRARRAKAMTAARQEWIAHADDRSDIRAGFAGQRGAGPVDGRARHRTAARRAGP
jgi:alkanesulfonate monooxygenase SsuD/methylene tetrahydromethanopterin reductase-like flavin-dependent oxidoreductase (luciferase family)